MAVNVYGIDQSAGTPAAYTAKNFRDAMSVFAGFAPAGRPLGAFSGVRPGTPSTTVFLSGAGSMTWNVAAHPGLLDVESAASAGPYPYSTDGADTGPITAQGASARTDIIYITVNDSSQDSSGAQGGVVGYAAGTPAQPATPAQSILLATIAVPATGNGAPVVSWVAPTSGVARPPGFCVVQSAAQSMPSGATTSLAFGVTQFDSYSGFSSGTTYTTPFGGLWHFEAQVALPNDNATGVRALQLAGIGGVRSYGANGSGAGFGISQLAWLPANRAVSATLYQSSGGAQNTDGGAGTLFSGVLLIPA